MPTRGMRVGGDGSFTVRIVVDERDPRTAHYCGTHVGHQVPQPDGIAHGGGIGTYLSGSQCLARADGDCGRESDSGTDPVSHTDARYQSAPTYPLADCHRHAGSGNARTRDTVGRSTPAPTPVPTTPTPAPATPAPPPPPPSGHRPAMPAGAVWADSFGGSVLNAAKWRRESIFDSTTSTFAKWGQFSGDSRLYAVGDSMLTMQAVLSSAVSVPRT